MHAETKYLFTLLVISSVIAILAGAYLGVALGMQVQASVTVLSAVGILIWAAAWGAFIQMCLRLRRGESAFSAATGRTLRIIGGCMAGLAAVSFLCALIDLMTFGGRARAFVVIDLALLPGIFLAVGVAARILRGLLTHAMALEAEQEGMV